MFVGYNSDGNDGFSFVTFVDIPANTTIFFTDTEWNGTTFDGGEGYNSWSHSAVVSAGTVVTIQNLNNTPAITASVGTAIVDGATAMDLENADEVVYMYLGTNRSTPTVFLSALANDGFDNTNGRLTGTGLQAGVNAISNTGNDDILVYSGSVNCNSNIAACSAAVADPNNWSGDGANNGNFPDFPGDVLCGFFGTAMYPATIYYSRASGDWDDNTTWSLTADGSSGAVASGVWPRRTDHVFIQAGHTVTIDAVDDNKSCGLAPDDLGRTNVGPFTASTTLMFYQVGDIHIDGTLSVTDEMMIENYTHITATGSYTITTSFVNLGYLEADALSTISSLDDMILVGTSTTIVNTNSLATDDLIISFTSATLCGTGTTALQNGGGSVITYENGASVAQICTSYTVTCSGGGCTGFPVTGTGTFPVGNTGPGGVGNQSSNQLWLRAEDLGLDDGDPVTSWTDFSGNGLTATNATVAEQPQFNANTVNSVLPSVSFDGGDYLNLGTPASLNFIPQTDSWSFFCVYNVTAGLEGTFLSKATLTNGTRQYQYTFDNNTFTSFIGGNYNLGSVNTSNAWAVSAHTNTTTRKDSWSNENANVTNQGVGAGQVQATDVLIGARRENTATDFGFPLTGNIAEIVMYSASVNTAQRIIISNYLAAKYNIALFAANDIYDMDDNANGDYDFEVVGVGQASDNTRQIDSRGTGIVRMWAPNDLTEDTDDFLLWGHDNGLLEGSTADVDGTIIEERLIRIWRVSETADVGTVNISFDISSLNGAALGTNLRLLIDRNGNGFADNDVTPVAATSFSNDVAAFSGINFQDGDRFTLGNTDLANPLPVELLGFRATVEDRVVRLNWATASETNNHFFTIERSKNAKDWQVVKNIPGAGTSQVKNYYETVDDGPFTGVSYYRLKQTDFDEKFEYFNIVRVVVDQEKPLVIYPNPFTNAFKVSADFTTTENPQNVKLFTSNGVEVPVHLKKENDQLLVDTGDIPNGLYVLRIVDGLMIKTIKVIKTDH